MAENFFPYTLANLVVGPIRILVAKVSLVATAPTKIQDVVGMVDPYTAVSNWYDFGASVNPANYSRGFTENELRIQQDKATVDSDVTDVARSFRFNVAEFTTAGLQILEQAPSVDSIAAGSGTGAQSGLEFGTFNELDHYRVAFVGRRRMKAGSVVEPGGATRGRMIGVLLYDATLTGDSQDTEFGQGNLANTDVTFKAYPDQTTRPGKHGKWLFEAAGTIT